MREMWIDTYLVNDTYVTKIFFFHKKENYILSPFQQEKTLIRKMLYTNAARIPQEAESDVWKSSFISLLFPREKPFDVAGKWDTCTK